MRETGEGQLIQRIDLDDRLRGGDFHVTIIVTVGRLRFAEVRGGVLEMDADGSFFAIETQMQMRVGNAQGQQRDCRHPQCESPFAASKHRRSMPQSLFHAIGTEYQSDAGAT